MITALAITAAGLGLLLAATRRRGPQLPNGGRIVDRRAYAKLGPDAAKHTRTRKASEVDALVLHQMGFSRGNDPAKYNKVTAHYVILPDGGIYQLHDVTTRLPAASSLNGRSVSVEFAGNFPARAGATDPDAFWGGAKYGMHQLTAEQAEAGRVLVDHLIRERGITHIFAHRQGGGKRENDPGPDIWREVGAWAVRERGLGWGGEGWSIGYGKPLPASWWSAGEVA